MNTKIIFLCPHSAAKSVASAALLRWRAVERGVGVSVTNAGTHPDPEILPIVRTWVEDNDLPLGGDPRLVSAADLDHAEVIVNIGCEHDDLPTEKEIIDWSIPNFSDDPSVAFAAIEAHVWALVEQLATAPN